MILSREQVLEETITQSIQMYKFVPVICDDEHPLEILLYNLTS